MIAGNLEKLETWAVAKGYKKQWSDFMNKTTQLAELLSTPKNHITKVSAEPDKLSRCVRASKI